MNLADQVMKSHSHFKNGLKYTLGNETVTKSLALIDCVVCGLIRFDKEQKKQKFFSAVELTQMIESRILLASNNGCIGDEYLGWYIDNIPDLRKQLEKLANSQTSQSGLSTDGQ